MRKSELANKLDVFIKLGVKYYSIFSKSRLQKKYDKSRFITGYYGLFKRYCIVKNLARSCGDYLAIYENVVLSNAQNLEIGNNVTFNTGSYLEAFGGLTIGDSVGISQGVTVLTFNHKFDRVDIPLRLQGNETGKVNIGSDVWIGSKSTILMNVSIGDGAVIGAGSVVTKDVPAYSVSVGVPSKVIRMRK